MRKVVTVFVTGLLAVFAVIGNAAESKSVSDYNVVWETHSNISRDSMPLGNGDIGLNVWTEENGDLLFYLSKTDAFDEHGRLLKLGRIRVHFSSNPFAKGTSFKQELCLQDGTIRIDAGDLKLAVWVDANSAAVHVDATSATPFKQSVTLEMWRTEKTLLSGSYRDQVFDQHCVDRMSANEPPVSYPDTLLSATTDFPDQIVWYHRNTQAVFSATTRLQGLDPLPDTVTPDPLLHRTFGGVIKGNGFVSDGAGKLSSSSEQSETHLTLVPLTKQTASVDAWLSTLKTLQKDVLNVPLAAAKTAHDAWWQAFWDRSDIRVSGGNEKETAAISVGWHLHRFMVACTARGGAPVKFNGAIFNVDGINRDGNPAQNTADDRQWGTAFWFQNQRHIYWPMLAAGDFEQFLPFFKMYRGALPMAKHRTRTYYKHAGAFFPETMTLWGTYLNGDYGWNRNGKAPGLTDNGYIRRYWQSGLELTAMMLQYYDHTQDQAFAKAYLLPIATEIMTFYDQHYKRDENGKIYIYPAQALESIWDVANPLPEIAGLRYCLSKLEALPHALTTAEQRKEWARVYAELPELPMTTTNGKQVLAIAGEIKGKRHNAENVNLYAVWPYPLVGRLQDNAKLAHDSFGLRAVKYRTNSCWHSDILFAAYAGYATGATHYLANRFLLHGKCRFPTFYVNGDWMPDLDNGGVCQNTIQSMLMQCTEKKILLLPAWPRSWKATFKLHAPQNTTVEARVENGKIFDLNVIPESRLKDVEIWGKR